MRTGYLAKQDDFLFTHGVYGDKISKMLEEMKAFLEENPKEVLIVDFLQFYTFTESLHERFVNDVVLKNFKDKAYIQGSSSKINMSLNDFWKNGKQVIIRYNNTAMADKYDQLWPDIIYSPFFNTASANQLVTDLNRRFDTLKPDKFNVFQAILTPQTSTIISHFFSSLRKTLAEPGNEAIRAWLETVKNKKKNGVNIVICDFLVLSRLADPIIKLNDLLL